MMVFHHCFFSVDLFKGFNVSFFPITQEAGIKIACFFKICVSIYAFITGYGLALSFKKSSPQIAGKEVGKWVIGRIIKTLSSYWIIVIISMIFCQILFNSVTTMFFESEKVKGILEIILEFLGVSYLFNVSTFNPHWWYISIAILFIISVPIFKKMLEKYGSIVSIAVIVAIPRLIGWTFVANSYFAFVLPLLIGMIFAEKNLMVRIANFKLLKKKRILNYITRFIIDTVILILLFVLFEKNDLNRYWEISYTIIPIFYIIYFYKYIIEIPILKKILLFLGKHSMNIFLLHNFLFMYLHDFIYSQNHFIVISFLLLGMSLVISIILELLKKLIRYDKLVYSIINCINNRS